MKTVDRKATYVQRRIIEVVSQNPGCSKALVASQMQGSNMFLYAAIDRVIRRGWLKFDSTYYVSKGRYRLYVTEEGQKWL